MDGGWGSRSLSLVRNDEEGQGLLAAGGGGGRFAVTMAELAWAADVEMISHAFFPCLKQTIINLSLL
jgi:hypothetical protein